MTPNYYAVTAKFGHVGRNKFIIKTIPIMAESKKHASEIARWFSRVKHHAKDAIIRVIEIEKGQYGLLKEEMKNDPYFRCTNIQDQRRECAEIEEQARDIRDCSTRGEIVLSRSNAIKYKMKKHKAIIKDCRSMMKYCEQSYVI